MQITYILFDDFETLDVFGPAEIFGRLTDLYPQRFYSQDGGLVGNRHGVSVMTEHLTQAEKEPGILLIPGGYGTRKEVENHALLESIRDFARRSDYIMSVCTGSALLARAGLLNGKRATSNKRAFTWVASQGDTVLWDRNARWTKDGKYYTSAGVSAGMDMALGFLSDRHGLDFARNVANEIEYHWAEEKDHDTFTAQ